MLLTRIIVVKKPTVRYIPTSVTSELHKCITNSRYLRYKHNAPSGALSLFTTGTRQYLKAELFVCDKLRFKSI